MPSFVTATVTQILLERPGLQRVLVQRETDDTDETDESKGTESKGTETEGKSEVGERAYVLTDLIGPVAIGDQVVANTTAVELGLGTGGWHVVHWNLSRREWSRLGPGHIMKLRYTSLQIDTGAAEEDGADLAGHLGHLPVVACLLHSQLAVVAAACKHERPDLRVAYVMTDQASLPLALSDLVHNSREEGLIDATITTGQAFGGDYEAVNVVTGIQAAKRLAKADVVIVAEGPGVVGTGSPLGFSGLEMASVLDAAACHGAAPFFALRWSDADPRPRHRGVSHHSTTVLAAIHQSVRVAVPTGMAAEIDLGRHQVMEVDVPDITLLLEAHGLNITTMGRLPSDDPGFFRMAAAAGIAAARQVDEVTDEASDQVQQD